MSSDAQATSHCKQNFLFVQGFSGGPLMCRQDGSWFLAGVLAAENKLTNGTQDVQGKSISGVVIDVGLHYL
ncbi:hypothetical protein, partial [Paraclostridium dentum]|uniref:hypothetical protein n=1 Tax=Paraclostridium dentum TaxID=2662455 RepID=UPI003F665EDF